MRRVINDFKRPSADLVQGFRGLLGRYSPSCIVSDVMERGRTLSSGIRPAVPGRFTGPALTVRLYPGDLVDCLDALKVAAAGDVIVFDAAAETEASVRGGPMAGLCPRKGEVGSVSAGAVSDIE